MIYELKRQPDEAEAPEDSGEHKKRRMHYTFLLCALGLMENLPSGEWGQYVFAVALLLVISRFYELI